MISKEYLTIRNNFAWILIFVALTGCAGSAFKETAQVDTIEAYEDFLESYPDGKYSEKARQRIEELYFVDALFQNNITTLRACAQINARILLQRKVKIWHAE